MRGTKRIIIASVVVLSLVLAATAAAMTYRHAKVRAVSAAKVSASCGAGGWKCGAVIVKCGGPYADGSQWRCTVYILRYGHHTTQGCTVPVELSAYGHIDYIDIVCRDTQT